MLKNATKVLITITFVMLNSRGKAQDDFVWTFYQCIEQGWSANIDVQRSELNRQTAEYNLEYNKAQYHPNLNATYTNSYNWGRTINPTTYQYVDGLVNFNNYGISSRMILFDGFITPTRIKQSRLGLELADGQLQQQKNWIAINIAGAYLQTLLAHEKVDIITKQLIASRALLYNTQKYFDQGIKSEGDILLVKSQLAKEFSDSILASNTLQLAKLSLIQLLEIPYVADFKIERLKPDFSVSFIPYLFPSSQAIYDSAIVRLPEIENSNLAIAYNELELKAARGGYFPVLSLSGSIGTNYASTNKIITQNQYTRDVQIGYLYSSPTEVVYGTEVVNTPIISDYAYFDQLDDNLTTSLSFGLSIPIYNRKQIITNIDKANINVTQAELDLVDEKNSLRKDIETDYLEYTLLYNQLTASKMSLEAYKESFRKIEKQFELQMTTGYELLLEKTKIFATESEIIQLQYQLLFKYVILMYYQSGEVDFPRQK